MKTLWVGADKGKRKFFMDYASKLRTVIPADSDIILVTDDGGKLNGFAALLSSSRVVDIIFFYINEESRRKHYGHCMLSEIERVVSESGIPALRCVLPRNTALLEFFYSEGYDFFDGGTEYTISCSELRYSEVYRKNFSEKSPVNAKTLNTCTSAESQALKAFYNKKNIMNSEFYNKKLSTVVFDGSTVAGLVLCESFPSGIIVSYIYGAKGQPESVMDCFRLICRILIGYGEKAAKLTLSFATGNDMEIGLIKHIAGGVVPVRELVREHIAIKSM